MMTLNEAKEVFINRAFIPTDDGSGRIHDPQKWREACHVISKWLEQEPCEDDISRQAVLEMAYDMSEIDGEHFTEPYMVVDIEDIQKLPSITPQPNQWIPVSERLPDKSGFYLVDQDGELRIMEYNIGHPDYPFYDKPSFVSETFGRTNYGIKAWMPLPEPYKAKSEG